MLPETNERPQGGREYPTLTDIQMDLPSAYKKLTGTYDEAVTDAEVYDKLLEVMAQDAKSLMADNASGQRFRYVETPLITAIRNGYLIEIQEPTVIANPGVLVGLNALLDRCASVTLTTGEVIHRHPDTVVVVTTNNNYAGCRLGYGRLRTGDQRALPGDHDQRRELRRARAHQLGAVLHAGSGYVSQAAEDMERIMTQLAEDAAYASYEQELSEELQAESDRIRYGNAHKGVHVNVNRMGYVDPSYMEAYQKVAPPLLLISKRLQKQVSQILKDYKEGGKLDNLPMGKRINVRNAVRNDGRLFYKLKLPNDRTDIAVAILNDESGSMSGSNRITHARSASIILHDFCKGLDIPAAIYGHTEFDDVELYAYAEFDSIDNKDQYRLMDMSARGIEMFAAAIGSDKPNIQRIYGDGFLDITNLEKLPVNLGRLIIQKVKNRYAA